MKIELKDKLIPALDLNDPAEARKIMRNLIPLVSTFKIGPVLFIREGRCFVEESIEDGAKIFLDLKLHDIPNTVEHAVRSAVSIGINFLTVHASGGKDMIKAAVNGAEGRCKILAVTLLTSLSQLSQKEIFGSSISTEARVAALADIAISGGADGVVSSPLEAKFLSSILPSNSLIVTPGIRVCKEVSDTKDDQSRTADAVTAVKNGATHIVVGRPILRAHDPVEEVRKILSELREAE
ncbi:MAG: orotidine 5'-phosphate decarboxylase [Candidatus Hydrogenedentes bacterium CG1_02_42_14]|nr:MAG: orotidine 5'-phosphate decarboxylase [Candidatus Hydrogenedentes bacterium CG1_02_42_14]